MDAKKQTNLTPELKEIYDRVMNTTASPKSAPSVPSPVNAPPAPIPTPPTAMPTPMPPAAPSMPPPAAMPSVPSLTPTPIMPQAIPSPTPAEDALSSSPAKPLSGGTTFSFSGTAQNPQPVAVTPTAVKNEKKSKLSMPVLIVLGVLFILVWGFFWAIIFGFIKR